MEEREEMKFKQGVKEKGSRATHRFLLPLIAIVLFVAAFLVQLEQYLIWGHWFDWNQVLADTHHETFTLALIFGGVLVLVLYYAGFVRRRVQK
jgi:hypothetical protein